MVSGCVCRQYLRAGIARELVPDIGSACEVTSCIAATGNRQQVEPQQRYHEIAIAAAAEVTTANTAVATGGELVALAAAAAAICCLLLHVLLDDSHRAVMYTYRTAASA